MKNEQLKNYVPYYIKEVTESVEKAMLFYNTQRSSISINMMTPQEATTYIGELKNGLISYRVIEKKLQSENIITNKSLSLKA